MRVSNLEKHMGISFFILVIILLQASNPIFVNGSIDNTNDDFEKDWSDDNQYIKDLIVVEDVAYVTYGYYPELVIMDISNPESLKVLKITDSLFSDYGFCNSITGNDSFLFLAYGNVDFPDFAFDYGICYINILNDSTDFSDFIIGTDFQIFDIALEDDLLYIYGGNYQVEMVYIQCYSVQDLSDPKLLSEYNLFVPSSYRAKYMTVNERHVYFTYGEILYDADNYFSYNSIIDFTNLAAPVLHSNFISESIQDMIFSNDLIIINEYDCLSFYQCTNNVDLTLLSKLNCREEIQGIDLVGSYLYVVTEDDFIIFDKTNVQIVVELDRMKNVHLGFVQVRDDVAFISNDLITNDGRQTYLFSFDVSNLEKIRVLFGFYQLFGTRIILYTVIGVIGLVIVGSISIIAIKIIRESRKKKKFDDSEEIPTNNQNEMD